MAAFFYWLHFTSRSRYSFSNITFVFITIFSFFIFYKKIYSQDWKKEILILSKLSVEDLEYNLLGIESFNDRLAEKNPCDPRHQQGKYKGVYWHHYMFFNIP
jgi:hypothetical protein